MASGISGNYRLDTSLSLYEKKYLNGESVLNYANTPFQRLSDNLFITCLLTNSTVHSCAALVSSKSAYQTVISLCNRAYVKIPQ